MQLCGGLGIQLMGKSSLPEMSFPDLVKNHHDSWFYCQEVPISEGHLGLPPYTVDRIQSAPSLTVSKEEKIDVYIFVIGLVALMRKGVNRMDLVEVFF